MRYSNYHTHTVFCDGIDTPREMVEKAIELGLTELGFSSHSELCSDIDGYYETICTLREEYRDKISIKVGIEYDYYSDIDTSRYDYVIGGLHYLKKGDKLLALDMSEEEFLSNVDSYWNGDFYSLCEDYFETLSKIYEKTECDIVAHFDLVTKYNENDKLFDTSNPRYLNAADRALQTLIKKPVIFEINTGAISRGYRTSPYPAPRFIEELKRKGVPIILSSDCHNKNYLTKAFDEYYTLATLDKLPERKK